MHISHNERTKTIYNAKIQCQRGFLVNRCKHLREQFGKKNPYNEEHVQKQVHAQQFVMLKYHKNTNISMTMRMIIYNKIENRDIIQYANMKQD